MINNIEDKITYKYILNKKKYCWLITGVAGFIGSNILEELLKLDQRVIGIDNLSTGNLKNLKEIERIVGKKNGKTLILLMAIYQILKLVKK